jgi:hypothetical protein
MVTIGGTRDAPTLWLHQCQEVMSTHAIYLPTVDSWNMSVQMLCFPLRDFERGMVNLLDLSARGNQLCNHWGVRGRAVELRSPGSY